ncbi:hypothetical protein CEXT_448861 [Caerostris extrusa]|uniref:Uncharacterized protein n=1 Tax=Caerostris extrusa TaxID=172846 RepID=A0AAV4PKV4_CAEEX|nr:hypothetical protein CEXT_448861 [Caerostris extrusa]
MLVFGRIRKDQNIDGEGCLGEEEHRKEEWAEEKKKKGKKGEKKKGKKTGEEKVRGFHLEKEWIRVDKTGDRIP